MRHYDPSKPLIFLHIPKTAGTSVREVFRSWYPDLSSHYFSRKVGAPPPLVDLHTSPPPTIFGHFNRDRGYGVDKRYPSVRQFLTILREPLDHHLSRYFYLKANFHIMANATSPPDDPDVFLTKQPAGTLRHFPRTVTLDNYREIIDNDFIEIGIVEKLEDSLQRIARKLNKPFDSGALPCLKVTPRDAQCSEKALRIFRDKNKLQYAVYNYVTEKFNRGPAWLVAFMSCSGEFFERFA